jgi:hypothetical protein
MLPGMVSPVSRAGIFRLAEMSLHVRTIWELYESVDR